MPTGYTVNVVDGKLTNTKDYLLRCARAFGFLAFMKDEPLDAPIPDEIPKSTFYQDRYEEAKEELKKLEAMTKDDIHNAAEQAWRKSIESDTRLYEKWSEENARCEAMKQKVLQWNPPEELNGVKEFAIQQLDISKEDLSWYTNDLHKDARLPDDEWYELALSNCKKDAERYLELARKEQRRYDDNSRYLSMLRESLEDM